MISAIVLAAGSSTRMGSLNKLLLTYKKKAVVTYVTENILAAGIEDVRVVVGYEAANIKNVLKDLPVTFIANPDYRRGMTSSIQCGITTARGEGYMICLADMILITPKEYVLLKTAFEKQVQINNACICLPKYKNEKGNPVIFSSFYKDAILTHTNMEGCKEIVQLNKKNIYSVEMTTDHILYDMDYPEDYEMIRRE